MIDRKLIRDTVRARLSALTPVCDIFEDEADSPTRSADGIHVDPYIVFTTSMGTPSPEVDLADTAIDLDWWLQVTCAASFKPDILDLVTDVDALLHRWTPTIPGAVCGPLKTPPGYDPGPVIIDRTVRPYRLWTPLQYRTTLTIT